MTRLHTADLNIGVTTNQVGVVSCESNSFKSVAVGPTKLCKQIEIKNVEMWIMFHFYLRPLHM